MGISQPVSITRLHKKDDSILWDGHLARPDIISRQDACTTRNFGMFFYLEISKSLTVGPCKTSPLQLKREP